MVVNSIIIYQLLVVDWYKHRVLFYCVKIDSGYVKPLKNHPFYSSIYIQNTINYGWQISVNPGWFYSCFWVVLDGNVVLIHGRTFVLEKYECDIFPYPVSPPLFLPTFVPLHSNHLKPLAVQGFPTCPKQPSQLVQLLSFWTNHFRLFRFYGGFDIPFWTNYSHFSPTLGPIQF